MQHKKNNDALFKELAKMAAVLIVVMMILISVVYYISEKAIAQYASTADFCPYGVYPCNVPNPYTAYPYPPTASVYPYNLYPYAPYPYPYPYAPYPYPYP